MCKSRHIRITNTACRYRRNGSIIYDENDPLRLENPTPDIVAKFASLRIYISKYSSDVRSPPCVIFRRARGRCFRLPPGSCTFRPSGRGDNFAKTGIKIRLPNHIRAGPISLSRKRHSPVPVGDESSFSDERCFWFLLCLC